jgi:hypothetical protein
MIKRLGMVLFMLVIMATFAGCGGGGGSGTPNVTGPTVNTALVNFSGQVTYNGAPMADAGVFLIKSESALSTGLASATGVGNASIRLSGAAGQPNGEYQAKTDDQGFFSFNQVIADEYTLMAVKGAHQAVKTRVQINAAITTVDVALSPTGNLTGTAGISGGGDASGIIVYLDGTSYVAVTDATGKFNLYNIPVGTYSVRAQKGNFGLSTGTSVTVVAAQTTTVTALTLSAQASTSVSGSISGTATKSGAANSGGVIVHVQGTPNLTSTDPAGAFQISGIIPGNYSVFFYAEGYAIASQTVTVTSGQNTALTAVTLAIGTTSRGGFSGRIIKNGTTSDRETNQTPLKVTAGTFEKLTISNADGSFAFHDLPLGQYALHIMDSDYTLASGTPATVEATNPSQNYGTFLANLGVTGTSRIVGSVAPISAGQFVEGDIYLFRDGVTGPIKASAIEFQGQFSFAGLPVGNYRIGLAPHTGYKFNVAPDLITLGNGQRVERFNLPVIARDERIISFSLTGTTLTALCGADIDSSYQIMLTNGGMEYYLPIVGTPTGNTVTGNIAGTPPGSYQVHVFNDAYDVYTAAAASPFILTPPAVNPATIMLQTGFNSISVRWQGLAQVASYSVRFFTDGDAVTPVAVHQEIFETENDFSSASPVSQWRVGITTHSNGQSSAEVLTAWVPGRRDLDTPLEQTLSVLSTGFQDTFLGFDSLYYLRQDAASALNRINLSTFAVTSSSFVSANQTSGFAGADGLYVSEKSGNYNLYKFDANMAQTLSHSISPGGTFSLGACPQAFEDPDGLIYATWIETNGSSHSLGRTNGADIDTLGVIPSFFSNTGLHLVQGAGVKTFTGSSIACYGYLGSVTVPRINCEGTEMTGDPLISPPRKLLAVGGDLYALSGGTPTTKSGVWKISPNSALGKQLFVCREGAIDMAIDDRGRFWIVSVFGAATPYSLLVQVYSNTGTLVREAPFAGVCGNLFDYVGKKFLHFDPMRQQMILAVPLNIAPLKLFLFDASHNFGG